ncbi:MAG: hypothetical protein PHE68_01695 [Candidatus Peribacteraceae bacterium]|nr:hypothetical protein [Candidatus Peribacteraceae bacterium]MDD5074360.1 hypothetical protein [Candidatus Peribacteraceae bacterium]
MRTLFLDLASHSGLLACVIGDAVVASEPVDHRVGDQELLPLLENLLKKSGWSFEDLTQVACVTGPGGFTSLRVAVALVNTLVHRLKIPGTGVHLSDLKKAQCSENDILWLHSTKKHELFIRGFGVYARQWPEATHVMLDVAEKELPKGAQWVGELIPEHEKVLSEKGFIPAETKSTEEILSGFLAKQAFTASLLTPWYGREG